MKRRLNRSCVAATLLIIPTACSTIQPENLPLKETVQTEIPAGLTSSSKGLVHLYFNEWNGPEIPVWVYVPDDVDTKTAPIMFMMHGAKRGAARYLSEWDTVADANGFIVVAPEFAKTDYPKSRHYNSGNVFKKDNLTRTPEAEWSFSAIEPIFDHVTNMLSSEQKTYTLYGHSAGSQFAHRFMYFKPNTRAKRIIPANAGWYTFADLDITYPYGLGGTGLTEEGLKMILQKDVVILLGDQDNDANHESLRRSNGAALQGPHRFARGKAYFDAAQKKAAELGVEFGWKLRVVESIAHSNGGIASASGDLIK